MNAITITRLQPEGSKALRFAEGKVLLRKVAPMAHAVRSLVDGDVVLWLDFDALLLAPLDERFYAFLAGVDAATTLQFPAKIFVHS